MSTQIPAQIPAQIPTQVPVKVFIASSLDGFIAGEGDDLSWLPAPAESPTETSAESPESPTDFGFAAFLEKTGALLMGRRTFDIVAGFDGPWPYGKIPLVVPTHRSLFAKESITSEVHLIQGDIQTVVAQAKEIAAASGEGHHVYIDGGALIRQALDAGLIDEMTVTLIPVVLGKGIPLFAGAEKRHTLELIRHQVYAQNGLASMTYRVVRG